jgi:hypothetical protein
VATSSRTVYVKRTHPYTVHELDCKRLRAMVDAPGPARGRKRQVSLDEYDTVCLADVPIKNKRCRLCAPGVR